MTRLRLASWNIHGGIGLDRRFDPERIARVIGELDAGLVALQEFSAPRRFALLAHLQRATGWHAVTAPTFVRRGSDFGNAVLSAWPVESARIHDLAVPGREPRNAIDVVVAAHGLRLRVVATHLGLSAAERVCQVDALLERIGEGDTLPTVLLGDFNEWRRRGGSVRGLDARFAAAPACATFPAPRALLALDRAWISRGFGQLRAEAHRSRLTRLASDHLPLVATIDTD
jgi:endonuclease/exonuclease/phosphatase family metal-dependent hydrolase